MNRYFKLLFFLFVIWGLSYSLAYLFFEDENIITDDKIALIPISGMITLNGNTGFFMASISGASIVEQIRGANEDPKVKAIVLEINSPGGTVMGSKVVVDAVKDVEKPIISVITESGTSGAYWVASQTDAIFADELSYVGSIGVMASYLEYDGLLDDYNVTYRRLVTGDYKDMNSPYREMTEEEEELIMERLEGVHNFFVDDVASGRNMSAEEVEDLATGIFYFGMDCVDNGLIDYIGDKEDAINYARNLTGIKLNVETFEEDKGWLSNLDKYLMMSSYFVGQGLGSILVQGDKMEIRV